MDVRTKVGLEVSEIDFVSTRAFTKSERTKQDTFDGNFLVSRLISANAG